MIKFEKVSKYKDDDGVKLPERATKDSAGYDFYCAEETIVPSWSRLFSRLERARTLKTRPITMDEIAEITKQTEAKPTLVPTGVKAYMEEGMYLSLVARSSLPLKHWIIVANAPGTIDQLYVDNPENEGLIYFQLINLSPFDIVIRKGEKIGQGIFNKFYKVDEDNATEERKGGFGSTDQKKESKK